MGLAEIVIGVIILAVSLTVRVVSYHVQTSDYQYFVAKWFQALATSHGLSAFKNPFADYAPLYLYILKLLTYIPISSLYSSKTLSFLFDILTAVFSCLILAHLAPGRFTRAKLFLAFAVMVSIPTVVLNSSLWGQSDALYAAGVVLALYFIFKDRPLYASLAFGAALSFKLQAIFFLPVLLGYLLQKGRAAWNIVWVPAVFLASVVPALLAGGAFSYWGLIYIKQSGEYPALNESSASVFSFFPNAYGTEAQVLGIVGLVLAAVVALAVIFLIYRPVHMTSQQLLLLAVGAALGIPYFLPHMHERYFYLADVLATLYALYYPRHWFLPVFVVAASFFSYLPYLSGAVPLFKTWQIDLRIPSILFALAGIYIAVFISQLRRPFAILNHD